MNKRFVGTNFKGERKRQYKAKETNECGSQNKTGSHENTTAKCTCQGNAVPAGDSDHAGRDRRQQHRALVFLYRMGSQPEMADRREPERGLLQQLMSNTQRVQGWGQQPLG